MRYWVSDTSDHDDLQLMMSPLSPSLSLSLSMLTSWSDIRCFVSLSSWATKFWDVSLYKYMTDGYFGERPTGQEQNRFIFSHPPLTLCFCFLLRSLVVLLDRLWNSLTFGISVGHTTPIVLFMVLEFHICHAHSHAGLSVTKDVLPGS